MNERIKELAEQAGVQEDLVDNLKGDVLTYIARPQDIQKFAQLIVRECLLKVNEIGDGVYEYDHSVVEKHVHNHFGVEE